MKYQRAEEQKQKKLEQFAKDAKHASADRDKIHAGSESLLRDKLKAADEDKKRHLEEFDKLAKKDPKTTSSTVCKTEQIPGILLILINMHVFIIILLLYMF